MITKLNRSRSGKNIKMKKNNLPFEDISPNNKRYVALYLYAKKQVKKICSGSH